MYYCINKEPEHQDDFHFSLFKNLPTSFHDLSYVVCHVNIVMRTIVYIKNLSIKMMFISVCSRIQQLREQRKTTLANLV